MNDKLQKLLETLIPFIVLGVSIALLFALLIMFSYLLAWGLLIGGVLWLIALAKQYFFPSHKTDQKSQGRIIEHDDKK